MDTDSHQCGLKRGFDLLLLNPRLPSHEKLELEALYEKFHKPHQLWLASSGSSRKKDHSLKLIALSYDGLVCACQAVNEFVGISGQNPSHWLQVLPFFHIGGFSVSLRAHLSGANLTVATGQPWNPKAIFEILENQEVTHTSLVPTQIFDLVEAGFQAPESLRCVLVGGAALDKNLHFKAKALNWPLWPGFGMTETSAVMASANDSSSDFLVLPHLEVRVNAEGFLQVKGPSVMRGWAQWQDGQAFFEEVPGDTWWTTSDKVELQQAQPGVILKVLGRDQDFVKINGEGVSIPALQEKLLSLAEGLQKDSSQSLVLMANSADRSGAELVLVCEKKWTMSAKLVEIFNAQVAPFERILRVQIIEEIPRTPLGKVDRSKL